jgi:hypothetical protein
MQIDPISLESPAMNGRNMKMPDLNLNQPEMESEYSFKTGVRGKYARQYAEGTNIVVLAPEISRHFPTSESVNDALRNLLELAKKLSLQSTNAEL